MTALCVRVTPAEVGCLFKAQTGESVTRKGVAEEPCPNCLGRTFPQRPA
jgi:hypothetical protein